MSAMQMVLHRNNASIINIQNYVVANWSRFYKGQVVTDSTRIKNWGTDILGYDNSPENQHSDITYSFSLSDIPLDFPISTVFYHEYKVEPIENINNSPFSNTAPFNPIYGVTTNDKNNFNSKANLIFEERHPNPIDAEYFDGVRTTMYANFGMQIKSLAVTQIENNSKTILGTKFYQNGFNIQSDSPSVLVLPGYWARVMDSGSTTFTQNYSNIDYKNYYRMDITTPASFSVAVGDLVIATTMLDKHPYTAVNIGDIDLIYSWTRNKTLNGGTAGHGLSLWFSNVNTTYSISRAIGDYPASRFVVYRYDPSGIVPRDPPPVPPPPVVIYDQGGGKWGGPVEPSPAPSDGGFSVPPPSPADLAAADGFSPDIGPGVGSTASDAVTGGTGDASGVGSDQA